MFIFVDMKQMWARLHQSIGKYGILVLVSIVTSVVFLSCDEELPPIVMIETEKPLLDTAYQGSIPSAQTKNVLLMDITGVRCNNCPKAAKLAHQISDENPGRVAILALYPSTPLLLTLPWPGYDTLVTPEAQQIASSLGSIGQLPLGSIDQILVGGTRLIDRSLWSSTVTDRLKKTTPFNIQVKSIWDETNRRSRVEFKVIANQTIPVASRVMVGLLEDGIISKQSDAEDTVGVKGVVEDYEHNHALRTVIGSTSGFPLSSNLPAGWVIEKHFYFKPAEAWKPENMSVIVWVYDETNKEVYQVQTIKLK